MTKWALIVDDRVDTISYEPIQSWTEVGDNVFGGFIGDGDGWKAPPPVAPPASAFTVVHKADIWRRATDAEATTIDAQLNAQSVRLRRMWQDSQTLSTMDELYPAVQAAFVSAFGAERAKELLETTA
ncbi:hypothetical protein [Labrys neptuniae]